MLEGVSYTSNVFLRCKVEIMLGLLSCNTQSDRTVVLLVWDC